MIKWMKDLRPTHDEWKEHLYKVYIHGYEVFFYRRRGYILECPELNIHIELGDNYSSKPQMLKDTDPEINDIDRDTFTVLLKILQKRFERVISSYECEIERINEKIADIREMAEIDFDKISDELVPSVFKEKGNCSIELKTTEESCFYIHETFPYVSDESGWRDGLAELMAQDLLIAIGNVVHEGEKTGIFAIPCIEDKYDAWYSRQMIQNTEEGEWGICKGGVFGIHDTLIDLRELFYLEGEEDGVSQGNPLKGLSMEECMSAIKYRPLPELRDINKIVLVDETADNNAKLQACKNILLARGFSKDDIICIAVAKRRG